MQQWVLPWLLKCSSLFQFSGSYWINLLISVIKNMRYKQLFDILSCLSYNHHFLISSCFIQWNLSLQTLLFREHLHSGNTSIQGTPPFRGDKLLSRKKVHIILISITYFEGTPLFREKDTLFLGPVLEDIFATKLITHFCDRYSPLHKHMKIYSGI